MHASGQWSALGTLLGGGTVVLYPDAHMDLDRVLDLIEREQIVALNLVGDASGRPLVDALDATRARRDTASLRLLGSGGSTLSAEVKDALLSEMPSVLAIVEGIGSSESPAQGVAVTTRGGAPSPIAHVRGEAGNARRRRRPAPDHCRAPVPSAGLATRGFVPLGYYKDRGRAQPRRSSRSTASGGHCRATWPRSRPTASVRLLGRGSLCINTGGEKVYPEEVEAVLRTHPAIADAVVLGIPDPTWGEAVAAIVAAAAGHAPPVARRAPRALPGTGRRVQGAALAPHRRRGRAATHGQARLRVGPRACSVGQDEAVSRRVLIPLPNQDFDTTEVAIPWHVLTQAGHEVVFATEWGGAAPECDPRLLSGVLFGKLGAARDAAKAYARLEITREFSVPIPWTSITPTDFDAHDPSRWARARDAPVPRQRGAAGGRRPVLSPSIVRRRDLPRRAGARPHRRPGHGQERALPPPHHLPAEVHGAQRVPDDRVEARALLPHLPGVRRGRGHRRARAPPTSSRSAPRLG